MMTLEEKRAKRTEISRRWREKNPGRQNEINKKYRASQKGLDTRRSIDLKKKFGITLDQYKNLLKHQCGKCAICFTAFDDSVVNYVDHCHKTGKVRGILCRGCNTGLGSFYDDLVRIKKAIMYLENPPASNILKP